MRCAISRADGFDSLPFSMSRLVVPRVSFQKDQANLDMRGLKRHFGSCRRSMMWGVVFGGVLMGTGVVLVTVGSRSLNAAETRRDALIQDAFVVSSASTQYAQFEHSETFGFAMDEPTYTGIYLWNLTNGEAVLAGTEAPRVSQVGPYVYEKKATKVNVTFHSTTSEVSTPTNYAFVSYTVESFYTFVPERSNGSESDSVVTLNATYARTLSRYREFGYSERLVVADYARQHMEAYHDHLHNEFIADTKTRALQFFLPHVIDQVQQESVGPAIHRQQQRVDAASIPGNLVEIMAAARTEMIPQVLGDVMKDVSDKYIPGILYAQYEAAKDHAQPRVLSNLLHRLKVEAVPVLLQEQLQAQQQRHVPITLNSLESKLTRLAFPYVMQEVYERSCLEAVPSILRTIKLEIVARDIATNLIQADVAQNNVIETWRRRTTSARVNFDAWIDDSPTGQARTGFELRPTSTALELSREVATLLIGSKSSNRRFSIVDYDTQATASYPLDVATDTPTGFGIWKQVIAMNETAITYLIQGVNNDVARSTDYITRDQVMFVRQYLMQWAQGDVIRRDRERFWRQNYARRTTDSDTNEPPVDLGSEQLGVQTGFNLQASGASTSGVTPAIARQLWTASDPFSFANVQGFTVWYDAVVLSQSTAIQSLLAGITGLTNSQLTEIGTWLTSMMTDGFIKRRAMRHWSDGTCRDVFKLPRTPCILYDLEPFVTGVQGGFEMNPSSDSSKSVAQGVREELWNASKVTSFLQAVHAADKSAGYGLWLNAILTKSATAVVTAVTASHPTFSAAQASAVMTWLQSWWSNELHVLNIRYWWRSATCWPRETLSTGTKTMTTTSGLASCEDARVEIEVSAQVTVVAAPQSPFSTTERELDVTQEECTFDSATSKYSKDTTIYRTTVREWSCDAFSTELSYDHSVADWKTGFEVAPLVIAANAAKRPSLATTALLWDPTNAVSFLNPAGYKRWVFDYTKDETTERAALVIAINGQISSACSGITGTGAHSAIFNVTLIGTDASCGQVAPDQVEVIQAWVSSQHGMPWVESALLHQWRRGDFANAMDIEPYRPSKQSGLELSTGCECSLTTDQGYVYSVPRSSLKLWDPAASNTFLTSEGYAMWLSLRNATSFNDSTQIDAWKHDIATASGLTGWEPWLDTVASWLAAWRSNEHLQRDVLGHWLHGTCVTAPPPVSVVTGPTTVSSPSTTCPDPADRYTVALNDTLDDLLAAASRPGFDHLFDAKVVEYAALVKPVKVVEATETWIECEFIATNQYTTKTTTLVSVKEYPSCNFLNVLANGSSASVPIVREEVTFEMNRTADDPTYVSMEVALASWNNGSSVWAFTNASIFMSKWQLAVHRTAKRDALEAEVNVDVISTERSTLSAVTDYLVMWETSSKSTRSVAEAWLRTLFPFLDLDVASSGYQGGFELMTSNAWRQIGGINPADLPSLVLAQYLWDAKSQYSFLNQDLELVNGLPVGFAAWREVYNGTDLSSERLVASYPPVATVERDARVAHHLSDPDRELLITAMRSATQLTEKQLLGISFWLMQWSENRVLRDYINDLWSTGVTPRGEEGVVIDLRRHAKLRFELGGLESQLESMEELKITEGSASLVGVPKATLRSLWVVRTTGSLVNPATRSVWCCLDLPSLGVCPDAIDEVGAINGSTLNSFVSIVQPVVEDRGTISRSSNLTSLALLYFDRQFGLKAAQVVAVASWWRRVPETSMFFRGIQAQRWASPPPVQSTADLRWFGYGLNKVFTLDEAPASRRAGIEDLMDNAVELSSSTCNVSTNLVLALWNASSQASFIHSSGLKKWLTHSRTDKPRDSKAMLNGLSAVDQVVSNVAAVQEEGALMCTIDAVSNWIASWEYHPLTRQFIEALWIHEPTNKASPATIVQAPSPLIQAFPLSSLDVAPDDLRLQARIAEVILNPAEAVGLNNLTHGFPIWRAVLGNCTMTKPSTYACSPSASKLEDASLRMERQAVLELLSSSLSARIKELDATVGATKTAVYQALELTVIPWLMHWLDHGLLFQYIVDHAISPDSGVQVSGYSDFPATQFINGSITNASFPLPRLVDPHDFAEHIGVGSERFTAQVLTFDGEGASGIVTRNSSGSSGFGELMAFCAWNQYDRVYAYDTSTSCALTSSSSYVIGASTANAIFDTFRDDQAVTLSQDDGRNLTIKRVSLLIDAYLAQPIASADECERLMEGFAGAYSLTSTQRQNACKTTTAAGTWLDVPALANLGLAPTATNVVKDLQAYLKYAATKFVYEPSVLQLTDRTLLPSDLSSPTTPLNTWSMYPVGGNVAFQNVAQVLKASTSIGFDLGSSSSVSSSITYLVPAEQDVGLVSKHTANTIGELVAINGSASLTVLGASALLKPFHATDGSQFMTAILAAKRIGTEFPPPKLLLYWEMTQRFVQLTYEKNVTRFGVPLMRYTVDDWQLPSSFPSGLDASALGDADTPVKSLNVSSLFDGLSVVLSSAPVTPPGSKEPARETAFDIDPVTGLVYHRRLSWQLTTHVQAADSQQDHWHKHVAKTWLPVLWIREQRSFSSSQAKSFMLAAVKSGPFAPEKLALWGVIGGSAYIVVGAAMGYIYLKRARMVRLRKMQSVMPATASNAVTVKSVDEPLGESVLKPVPHEMSSHIDATSDVGVGSTDVFSTSPRARKRTTPRIETIHEVREEGSLDV